MSSMTRRSSTLPPGRGSLGNMHIRRFGLLSVFLCALLVAGCPSRRGGGGGGGGSDDDDAADDDDSAGTDDDDAVDDDDVADDDDAVGGQWEGLWYGSTQGSMWGGELQGEGSSQMRIDASGEGQGYIFCNFDGGETICELEVSGLSVGGETSGSLSCFETRVTVGLGEAEGGDLGIAYASNKGAEIEIECRGTLQRKGD